MKTAIRGSQQHLFTNFHPFPALPWQVQWVLSQPTEGQHPNKMTRR